MLGALRSRHGAHNDTPQVPAQERRFLGLKSTIGMLIQASWQSSFVVEVAIDFEVQLVNKGFRSETK